MNTVPQPVAVESFGYRHDVPSGDALLLDLRRFHDPYVDPALRELTGHHPRVRMHVLTTPGVAELVNGTLTAVVALLAAGGPARVLVGCAGGRHRSVAVAEEIARQLTRAGVSAVVTHHHVDRPVLR